MNTPQLDPAERQPANLPHRIEPFGEWLEPKYDIPTSTRPRNTPHLARTTEDTQTLAITAAPVTISATTAAHGIIHYAVSGTIDATTCGVFGAHLDEITAAAGPFVLDLTSVPFVSVGGLSLIEALAHTTARLDIRWALAAQYSLHRFLTLLNIDAHIPSFDTDEAALAHLTNDLGHRRPSGAPPKAGKSGESNPHSR